MAEKKWLGMRIVVDERVPPDRLALVKPGMPPKLLGVLINLRPPTRLDISP